MNKKILVSLVIGMFFINFISAIEFEPEQPDTAWGRFLSKLQFSSSSIGSFTVFGQELGCEQFPSIQERFKKGVTITITADEGDSGFVNFFRGSPNDLEYVDHPSDSRQFIGEEYIEDGFIDSVSWECDAGNYWNEDCYWEIYDCDKPCRLNSECNSGEFCDKTVLSQKIAGAGVCRESIPTHTTQVFRCEDGVKTNIETVNFGSSNFCNSPLDTKYLTGTIDRCLSSQPEVCFKTTEEQVEEKIEEEIERLKVQEGITLKELKERTTQDLTKSLCITTGQCKEGVCQSLKSLEEQDKIEDAETFLEDNSKIFFTSAGAFLGIGGCLTIAGGLGAVTGGVGLVVFPLCALAGAGLGASIDEGLSDTLDSIEEALSNKDSSQIGYCIVKGEGLDFFEFLAFFDINGDGTKDKDDGEIIAIILGLLLMVVIFKK